MQQNTTIPTSPVTPTATPDPVPKKSQSESPIKQLEEVLDLYLGQKAPAMSQKNKELIVSFSPWIITITVLLTLPLILAAIGIGALFGPFSFLGGVRHGISFNLFTLFLIASTALEIFSIPGLFKRTAKAWRLVFYGNLINAVYYLSQGNIGGVILGTGISLYILFQVKEYYSN